ncbi:hypothetical protein [Hoeflea sp. EC-HK425]|uniref:hypothetical protein n=1 Tax=Hoeflea sp. EC-HK425 TaxID=2038388 RepID=UPI001258BF45|nr:hypothetical protein [Hoeflea sp. EC-HK425]VVT18712.1 conserved hypothetical protein [Hoeflea sp. EC-HK425]|tara:strand:+ start:96 stop:329 length:234 start_codon:yes stop_codon:yes gene_type:complete
MTTILTFDQSRCRKANPARSTSKAGADIAQVLLFTGVRREPLSAMAALPAPAGHEPMFDDTAPDKPTGKKRRRGKTG